MSLRLFTHSDDGSHKYFDDWLYRYDTNIDALLKYSDVGFTWKLSGLFQYIFFFCTFKPLNTLTQLLTTHRQVLKTRNKWICRKYGDLVHSQKFLR